MRRKLLSIFLALCMVMTMLPVTAMGEEASTSNGEMGEIIEFEPLEDAEKTVPLGTAIEDLELPQTLIVTVMQSDTNQQTVTEDVYVNKEVQIDIPVIWASQPEYDMKTEGTYIFTPVIEGYTVSTPLPKITIMVGAAVMGRGMNSLMYTLHVAQIETTGYTTLQDAFDVVVDGQTIKLLDNITLDDTVKIASGNTKSFTLDLNGKTLNSGSNIAIQHSGTGTLTIKDTDTNGKITSTADRDINGISYGTIDLRGGSLKVESGTVENTLESEHANAILKEHNYNGVAIVTGGTIISTVGTAIYYGYILDPSDPTIPSGILIPNGTPTINGGLIAMNQAPDLSSYTNVKVTVSTNYDGSSPDIYSEANIFTYKYLKFEPGPVINYNVWVSGVQVTSTNASDVLRDKTVSYTPATDDTPQILTLTNANITYNGGNAIYTYMQDIIVVLNGTNFVESTSTNDDTAFNTISGGSITFRGDGTLTAKGKYGGIYAFDNLTIESGTILATGQKAGISCNNGSITISGSNVTGQATTSSGYGIGRDHSRTLKLTVSGDAIVTAVGTNGAKASNRITITNTTHNVIAGDNESSAKVVASLEESTWANSYVKLNPGNIISGIITSGEKAISGANVQIQKNGVDFGVPAITAGDGKYTTQYVPDGKYTIKISRNGYNHAEIEEFTVSGSPVSGKDQNLTATSLTGTATISNTSPRIGDVLNGSLDSGNNTGTLTYVWKADETQVGTGESYTVAVADLGKTITLEISSDAQTGTVKSMPTVVVLKKVALSTPDAPTLISKTYNSVTLTANGGYEFSKDGTTWQTSNVFSGLTTSTAYTFYQRIAETNDTERSTASTGLTVTTNSNDGGSSNGGGSVSTGSNSDSRSTSDKNTSHIIVTRPTADKPNDPTQGEIKVPGTADDKGNITVKITNKTVTEAFDKAFEDAKKNGNEQNGITVSLRVDTGTNTGSNVTVNLPKTVQETIIAKKIINTIVVVENPDIRIGMDLITVEEINKQANSDVNISATRANNGNLSDDAKKAIGNRPVFDLKVNYGNNKQVESFGRGTVSVTIPYTLGRNEKAINVKAVYIDNDGNVYWLIESVYDEIKELLHFSTDHLSTYGIGYKEDVPEFMDIANHWAKEDIEFVVNSGIFSRTSTTTFSPNTDMTRGMFVAMLGRLANAHVSGYKESSFVDVKSDAYYMGYIEWASKYNIVKGTGNGSFAPEQPITREQMAVIMQNYAKTIGFTLPKIHVENTFGDSSKISAYSKNAVKQLQMAGILSGKNANLFDPQGIATRAEVSAVLRRFMELEF